MFVSVAIRVFVLVFLMILGESFGSSKGLVSVYDHYGVSAGGAELWKYPATMRLTTGRRVYVFPCAMYTDRVAKYKYSVWRVSIGKRSIHCHIVDECDAGDCHENTWKARRLGGMLYDVHESALSQLGIGMSLYNARVTYVGKIPRSKMGRVISSDGRRGYVPRLWH